MGRRNLAVILSALLLLASVVSLATRGLNFGVDFTGGLLLEVGYAEAADLGAIRSELESAGFGNVQAQNFGSSRDVLIRVLPREEDDSAKLGQQILDVLEARDASVELRRVEFVGPQVGRELTVNY